MIRTRQDSSTSEVVHQNHEEEKNLTGFFDCGQPSRFDG